MACWLHLAAAKHPDRVAIEGPDRRLTYAELSSEAIARCEASRSDGVGPGDRVPLASADPVEFAVALHACLLAGAAAVPIDLRLTAAEQEARARPGPVPVGTIAVMHTSGTTAAPKPVALTDENFQASALGSAVALGLDQAERWLCPMPLTHVGGLSIPIRSAIYATTAVLHGRFDTGAALGELMDPGRRITLVSLVPTMLARLLDAGLERPPTLRWALLGGGPIPEGLLDRARAAAVPVAPTYGMTEACSQIATFGWPLPGVEIRLRGPEREIAVRGAIVAPDAGDEEGWLHTGDLGSFDARGRLRITGRSSDTIVSGGENVSPAEVEEVLLDHPAVADAGVFGRPDPEWGEALVAVVVPRDGDAPTPEALREFCAERLARFKVPKTIEFVDELPRTESGKLLRRRLTRLV
jgi:O-succinylbenzoic acid--CoA ligase